MESRKITVLSTKIQAKKTFMSSAETLGELKKDLDANGIDYTNMAFYEGTARIELKDDSSALPKDVPYKGNVTNDLVFMLTTANKKIPSGADRMNIYAFIRDNNLQSECIKRYGKNYTTCKTSDLEALINDFNKTTKETDKKEANNKTSNKEVSNSLEDKFKRLVECLCDTGYLEPEDCKYITTGEKVASLESSYSEEDIEDMFDFIN